MKKILLISLLILSSFFLGFKTSSADNNSCLQDVQSICSGSGIGGSKCTDAIGQCQTQIGQALDQLNKALAPNEALLNSLQDQIKVIKDRVGVIEQNLADKQVKINKGYDELTKQKDKLNKIIADYYIRSSSDSPLYYFASSSSLENLIQELGQRRFLIEKDKEQMINFALLLIDLENQKNALQGEEDRLTSLKSNLDQQSAKLDAIVSSGRAYQSQLESQLGQLSAIQQQVLGQRLAALGIPLYASMAGGCSSDIGKNPGFSGGYGFFTYGVPNRVGLNQFGAFGRAKGGQNSDQILHAYYNFDSYQTFNGIQINVQGYHGYDLEDYVKRIYEVPNSWGDQGGMEALKAQAIAVRSYALAYTNTGQGSICTTQDCQVFQDADKGGNWDAAVDATKGQVMVQGGNPIKAWFSSTHGGYVFSSADVFGGATGWTKEAQDTSSPVNSFADLKSNAYDKDSPWFYCDWGSRSSYNSTAWLRNDEVADIANVLLLAQADSSVRKHLYQTDKPNPEGTDTWDAGRVKTELQNRSITPFNSVSSVSVSADFGSGRISSVNVSGDRPSVSFGGSDFKIYFNLRAPANIQIVGPLYNVETE